MASLALATLVGSESHAAWLERAYAVGSRPGVEVSFVVAADSNITDVHAVTNMVVMFSGGSGAIRSPQPGAREQVPGNLNSLGGFLAERLGVAVSIGLPSDQSAGLSMAWRESAEHLQDVGTVADVLMKQYPAARITLLGFSNGARSASYVGAALAPKWGTRLQGVVLMSASIEAFRGEWMRALEGTKERSKVPLLVVHHKRDSCLPYNEIEAEARWHDLISVDDHRQPRVNAFRRDCGPGSAHQFSGREDWTYQAVVDWIKTGKVTELSN
jgi:dienelactone hydrolase